MKERFIVKETAGMNFAIDSKRNILIFKSKESAEKYCIEANKNFGDFTDFVVFPLDYDWYWDCIIKQERTDFTYID